jgi:hypothetical protein
MPNRAIEIHDSVLAGVSFSRGEAQLHFSLAHIHPSEGVPGRDAGSGWVQEAILRMRDARVEGAFSELPVDLSDDQIQMEKKSFDNEIPVPLRHKGAFELRLRAVRQGQGVFPDLLGLLRQIGAIPNNQGRTVPCKSDYRARWFF